MPSFEWIDALQGTAAAAISFVGIGALFDARLTRALDHGWTRATGLQVFAIAALAALASFGIGLVLRRRFARSAGAVLMASSAAWMWCLGAALVMLVHIHVEQYDHYALLSVDSTAVKLAADAVMLAVAVHVAMGSLGVLGFTTASFGMYGSFPTGLVVGAVALVAFGTWLRRNASREWASAAVPVADRTVF